MSMLRPMRSSRVSPGFLAGSSREDDHGTVGSLVIGPGMDLHGGGVWEAVAQVHGFPAALSRSASMSTSSEYSPRCIRLKAMEDPTKPQPMMAAFHVDHHGHAPFRHSLPGFSEGIPAFTGEEK